MNPLDYDPTYPRDPKTLAQYIRKYRKDKGLTGCELAERLGVAKFTVVKWEGGRMPTRHKREIRKLTQTVPGVGRYLQKR